MSQFPYANPRNKRQRILNKTKGHCFYCNVKLQYKVDRTYDADNAYETDHLIPKSKGGTSVGDSNFVPSCKKCNRQKFNMTVAEWYNSMANKRDELLSQARELENLMSCLDSRFKGIRDE